MSADIVILKQQLEDRLTYLKTHPIDGFNGLNPFHSIEKKHIVNIEKNLILVNHLIQIRSRSW